MKGTTEDEMVGWHHRLNGHWFGWTPGVGDGQGGLACCGFGVAKSRTRLSDRTELRSLCPDWLVFCDCGLHSVCPLMEKDKRRMEAS